MIRTDLHHHDTVKDQISGQTGKVVSMRRNFYGEIEAKILAPKIFEPRYDGEHISIWRNINDLTFVSASGDPADRYEYEFDPSTVGQAYVIDPTIGFMPDRVFLAMAEEIINYNKRVLYLMQPNCKDYLTMPRDLMQPIATGKKRYGGLHVHGTLLSEEQRNKIMGRPPINKQTATAHDRIDHAKNAVYKHKQDECTKQFGDSLLSPEQRDRAWNDYQASLRARNLEHEAHKIQDEWQAYYYSTINNIAGPLCAHNFSSSDPKNYEANRILWHQFCRIHGVSHQAAIALAPRYGKNIDEPFIRAYCDEATVPDDPEPQGDCMTGSCPLPFPDGTITITD